MNVMSLRNVKKAYPLYRRKKDKLLEAFSLSGKSYHTNFYALNGVSFDIQRGECVGIIGLNGSGKSTLLKIITGVVSATEGTAEIHGKISALLELGAGFNPEYTGIENIYLNSTIMGYSTEETNERLQAILDFAELGDFIYQPVKTYSSGMFVRLAFSIAINVDPDILIIDEALSVGDVFFQQKCYQKIKELAGRSTVLIVSHDLNAMTKFCKRMLLLNHGELVYDGDSSEAITKYYKIKQGTLKGDLQAENVDLKNFDNYKVPTKKLYSGNMNVVIDRYFYAINDIPFSDFCQKGDTIQFSLVVNSSIILNDLIVGYQVRDKFGNEIFGETSLTCGVEQFSLNLGENLITWSITWPEIREGDYFITLGIGNGTDVLKQVEECWINNIIHVISTTHGKVIFGLFNQPMNTFNVDTI